VLIRELIIFKLLLMVGFSLSVAAATMMESPDEVSEMAWPMVLAGGLR
jgi:hypothetical protein